MHPFSFSLTRFGITFSFFSALSLSLLDCCDCNVKQAKAMIVIITIIIMMEDNDIARTNKKKITVIISLKSHCMCAYPQLSSLLSVCYLCDAHLKWFEHCWSLSIISCMYLFVFAILLFCICHVMHLRLFDNIRLTCFPRL